MPDVLQCRTGCTPLSPFDIMAFRISVVAVIGLLSLFIFASMKAQDEAAPPPIAEAKTFNDVMAHIQHEAEKLNVDALSPKERAVQLADFLIPASEKLLQVAEVPMHKQIAYQMKFSALASQAAAEIDGSEEKFETFFKEITAMDEFKERKDQLRFMYLMIQKQIQGDEATEPKFEAFIKELEAKESGTAEQNELRPTLLNTARFFLFQSKSERMEVSPENFNAFLDELKGWTYGKLVPLSEVVTLGFEVAQKQNVPAERVVQTLKEYIQASTLPDEGKKELSEELERALQFAPGSDLKLYGRTLDDKDFDWSSLRDKYVLVKFTATWCGPCKAKIPAMLDAYKKYKDKGLEIVSVYIMEPSENPVASVKSMVDEEKLPWIILSEALTTKALKPPQRDFYAIRGVPTFVLTDKDGKIMMPVHHEEQWKDKLKEIFE